MTVPPKFAVFVPMADGVTADPDWMASFAGHLELCGFESITHIEQAKDVLSACAQRVSSVS
jgi:hypothetical protein